MRTVRPLICALLCSLLSGCWSVGYIGQQAIGQIRLLRERRKIKDVLADPTTDPETLRKLELAQAARNFGVEVIGLRGGDNFTRFLDLHGKPVAWNVSAAPKDQLRPITHHFPITGAVPYLGYFQEKHARKEEAKLRARDLDVYVRSVAGYSTLGKLSDPIYSSMLEGSPARIVEIVLHEMTHGTLWIPGRADFNESFATFVGLHGAALYFAATSGAGASQRVFAEAAATAQRERQFSAYLRPFLDELEALYARPIARAEKLRLREEVFARARQEFLRVFHIPAGRRPLFFNDEGGGLNNAVFVSYAVYHRKSDLHERIFERVGRDLSRFLEVYKTAAERERPIEWLEEWAKRH